MTAQRTRQAAAGTGPGEAEASALASRVDGLRRLLRVGDEYLPSDRLVWARSVVSRTDQRLALSREHTVVALAGATGGGKSSLFNALAGRSLSPVGVRRPTTSEAHACVWGAPEEITDLLAWLRVSPAHWFGQAQVVDGQSRLRGLVLLDLPDFDSVERQHAAEVMRLLGLVDLVVWVVDPQKYADQVIHEHHLPRFRRHREVTVVALNQADLLTGGDLDRLMADLRRLLNADGLEGVSTIATSAVDAPAGLAQLRATLEEAVTSRRAAVQRLSADVDLAVEDLSDLVGPPADEQAVSRAATRQVADGLAELAGVAAVTEAMATSYRFRAIAAMSWPLARLLHRRGPDPWRRSASWGIGARPVAHTPEPVAAPRAAAGLVARRVSDQAGARLPDPWPEAVATAARSGLDGLPEALDAAVAEAVSQADRTPTWWRAVEAAQWLAMAAVLVGLGWWAAVWLSAQTGMPIDPPTAGPVPLPVLLAAGGAVAGVLLALVSRPLARWAAGRAAARAAARLRATITDLAAARVVGPVQAVLGAYEEARRALQAARGT